MPVTVEPGVYIPGELGVRIEDLLIVTKFGAVNLTKSEKKLIIL
jgi:Xaa-Pro aminopeptidase